MQVRLLRAATLGNQVVRLVQYYCNKSQFMIMTQEEVIHIRAFTVHTYSARTLPFVPRFAHHRHVLPCEKKSICERQKQQRKRPITFQTNSR